MVSVPALLADLIRQVLTSRLEISLVGEITGLEEALEVLRDLAPDVVIVGPSSDVAQFDPAQVRRILPEARVLALSADLLKVRGPREGDVSDLTPEKLAELLLE